MTGMLLGPGPTTRQTFTLPSPRQDRDQDYYVTAIALKMGTACFFYSVLKIRYYFEMHIGGLQLSTFELTIIA